FVLKEHSFAIAIDDFEKNRRARHYNYSLVYPCAAPVRLQYSTLIFHRLSLSSFSGARFIEWHLSASPYGDCFVLTGAGGFRFGLLVGLSRPSPAPRRDLVLDKVCQPVGFLNARVQQPIILSQAVDLFLYLSHIDRCLPFDFVAGRPI